MMKREVKATCSKQSTFDRSAGQQQTSDHHHRKDAMHLKKSQLEIRTSQTNLVFKIFFQGDQKAAGRAGKHVHRGLLRFCCFHRFFVICCFPFVCLSVLYMILFVALWRVVSSYWCFYRGNLSFSFHFVLVLKLFSCFFVCLYVF